MIPNSSLCLGSFCWIWFQNDHFIVSLSLRSPPRDHYPQNWSTLDDPTRQLFPGMCSSPHYAILPAIQTGNPYDTAVVKFKVSPWLLPWRQNPKRDSHPGQTSAVHMQWLDQRDRGKAQDEHLLSEQQQGITSWNTSHPGFFLQGLLQRALCAPTKSMITHSSR